MAVVLGLSTGAEAWAQSAKGLGTPATAAAAMKQLAWQAPDVAGATSASRRPLTERVGVPTVLVQARRGNHALLGGIVGGVAGLVVGFWLGDQVSTSCEASCGGLSIAAGVAGGVAGGGVGALIGWAIPKRRSAG